MKEYFKDYRGWVALVLVLGTILAMGATKALNIYTNASVVILFLVSCAVVVLLHMGTTEAGQSDAVEEVKFEES